MSILVILISFNNEYGYNSWELLLKILIIVMGLFALNFLESKDMASIAVLVLSIILASILLISANNLLAIYIAMELQSLSLFILIAKKRNSVDKVEAALKYFVLSSISSGFFLLGSALYFSFNGSCDLYTLSISTLSLEKVLIIVALLFKLSAAPFHIWAPDIYQGCDNSSLILLGTLPKISILGVMIVLLPNVKLILFATIISLLVGCVGALNQTNIKKLLAYSGIINMGFILLGISTNSFSGIEASVLYVFIYSLSFLFFIFIINLFMSQRDNISEFSGLLGVNTVLLVSTAFLVLSLAGIPPFAGFLIKWIILTTAISYNFIFSSIISIVCAVIAGVYYLRLLKISYFQVDKSFFIWKKVLIKDNTISLNNSIILGLIFFITTFLIVCPHIFLEIIHFGTLSVF